MRHISRGGFHPMRPKSRPVIKASVEIPALVAGKEDVVKLRSDEKGSVVFEFSGGVEVRIDDDVLNDALMRVQQPDLDVIGMPAGPGWFGGLPPGIHPPPTVEEHEEVFEGVIEVGQEKRLQVNPSVVFRPRRMEICVGSDTDVLVKDVLVGVDSQLADPDAPIPLAVLEGPLDIETAMPGILITFVLKNRSETTKKVKFRLVGERLV